MAAITPLRSSSGREPRGPGRPRISGRTVTTGTAREEILDQAARLFTEHGYSATSTRDIAEACGVRQASLYYRDDGTGSGTGVTRFTIDAREGCP